jgi:3-hydroxymyristoyl/3-hydroxydecanoyl-(acyl carrier protein) dehydratase
MRYRFIDRILAVDAAAGTIRTCKVFPRSEDYLDGTFRREGEVPVSLVLEALAAAGSLLLAIRGGYHAHGVLLKIGRAAFPRRVRGGDRLTVEAGIRAVQALGNGEADRPGTEMAELAARGRVDDVLVVEAEFLFLCVPMAWSFGPGHAQVLTELLELIGLADARP